MKEICIYGAGGLGKEIYSLIMAINRKSPEWNITGFYDDAYPRKEQCMGLPVIGDLNDLRHSPQSEYLIMAIGDTATKRKVIEMLKGVEIEFPVLIHPTVTIDMPDTVAIGGGSIIAAGARLTADIDIGRHVLINLNATIGHDASLDDYCSIMPSVNIAGNVHLSQGVFVGAGASVINGLLVGQNTTIGAGAVVVRDVPADSLVAGVPAKPIIK
jgi:sugar O-acyltransferase (sialic acid O-acetyltransferase NeuD family)